jgi:drug/metabolite transporter (DMT)-like permease
MGFGALFMIVGAGALHAGWNALTKKSADQFAFCWVLTLATVIIFAIPTAVLLAYSGFDRAALPFMLVSGTLHIAYFALLATAYRTSELGLAYPVARGTGVMLIPFFGVLLFNEAPTFYAWLGIALLAFGLIWLHEGAFRSAYKHQGWRGVVSWWALGTGIVIATYSLVDSRGVKHLNPAVYYYGANTIAFTGLSLVFLLRQQKERLQIVLQAPKGPILAAIGSFITYTVVLAAKKIAPVSYVGPMREVSIVFGVFIGARFLGERLTTSRIVGALLVLIGILTIKIGG